jgi:hypothetical protein
MAEKSKISGFKSVPSGEEKCIWMEAGVIDYKLCNYYYNCHECPRANRQEGQHYCLAGQNEKTAGAAA